MLSEMSPDTNGGVHDNSVDLMSTPVTKETGSGTRARRFLRRTRRQPVLCDVDKDDFDTGAGNHDVTGETERAVHLTCTTVILLLTGTQERTSLVFERRQQSAGDDRLHAACAQTTRLNPDSKTRSYRRIR